MPPASIRNSAAAPGLRENVAWYCLAALIVLVFLMGGGARDDIQSLLVLRPFTAGLLAAALWLAFADAWRTHRVVTLALASPALLMLVHLLPLPPALWSSLPGREVIVQAFAASGQELPWLPLSIAPNRTWNALFFWMAPFAAFLLALKCLPLRGRSLVILLLAIGALGVVVAVLQVTGPADGPLYFYRITNQGSAVGWFANRNHFAMFLCCLFPLVAAYLSLLRVDANRIAIHRNLTLAAAATILPVLLVTGSRGGLVTGLVGLVLALLVYSAPQVRGRKVNAADGARTRTLVFSAVALVALAVMVYASSRALSFDRLFEENAGDDLRWRALPALWQGIQTYFPFGSGIGSFVETYQIHEPADLIAPNYFNHAHNDYVEIALTAGLPGIFGLVLALGVLARVAIAVLRQRGVTGLPDAQRTGVVVMRASLAILLVLAVGSALDYPLRTPALAVLAAIAVAATALGWRSHGPSAIAPASGRIAV